MGQYIRILRDRGKSVRRTASTQSGVRITVQDNGSGIGPELSTRIFEPFVTTKGARGTGLGLATVRAGVELAGGRVDVQSGLGSGTTFDVELPAVEGAPEPLLSSDLEGAKPTAGTQTRLLVEDGAFLRTPFAPSALLTLARRLLDANAG